MSERTASDGRDAEQLDKHAKIRQIFSKWDVDGRGLMSKGDLRNLLESICMELFSEGDLDACFNEADLNGDGFIEYDEFLRWVLLPTSFLRPTDTESGLTHTDIEAMLRPLYNVYDQNGDQGIELSEFVEAHDILQNAKAMKMPTSKDAFLAEDTKAIFHKIDQNQDGRITFDEFVAWQRDVLDKSGLSSDKLATLVGALARQLNRVFKMSEKADKVSAIDEQVLDHIIANMAVMSHNLWNNSHRGSCCLPPKIHYSNRWSKPPAKMSLGKMRAKHFAAHELNLDSTADVLCIPFHPEISPEQSEDCRMWLAKVITTTTRTDKGKRGAARAAATRAESSATAEGASYYTFETSSWGSEMSCEDGENFFQKSFEALPPEVRLFALLKSEVDFGTLMTWAEVQRALLRAVAMGLLRRQDIFDYKRNVSAAIFQTIRQGVQHTAEVTDEDLDVSVHTFLESFISQITMSPRELMVDLAEQGVFQVSSVWADFME